jgi:2-hydroxy-6-oxonona-2,4-dienedioate hydrolase
VGGSIFSEIASAMTSVPANTQTTYEGTNGASSASASVAAIGAAKHVVVTGLAGVPVKCEVVEIGQPAPSVPVVFLHGLVGLNDHWEHVVHRIKHRARAVLVQTPLLDLTGDDCSIHGATELTIRLLATYLKQPAVLVGNSFGGHIAAKMAIARPDLVRGLVLAGASGLIEKSMVSDVQIRPSREWLQRKIGELFYDQSKMNPDDVERAYKELTDRDHARAMVRLSRTARKNHLGEELRHVKAPTLIIWGRQDIVTPPEACDQFASKIVNNSVVWLDNCGHAPMIEKPDEFGAAMNDFLNRV